MATIILTKEWSENKIVVATIMILLARDISRTSIQASIKQFTRIPQYCAQTY